ncbi:MAG: hypothetical protein HF982_04745 [Desulfobacteraceae bacterium]|nr:hypothetical protein [Desulfobacteraceae bacterium]MBC2718889.1 hypothetical protein [Desulfobacteraceae bacterium]
MKSFNLFKGGFLTFFSIIGASWTVVKFIDFFWGNIINWHKSNYTFSFIVFVSLCYSTYTNLHLKKIRTKISGTEAYLTLKYGDILDYEGHIAVSSSNFFNTSLNIISERSLLGQIIKKFFNSDNREVKFFQI